MDSDKETNYVIVRRRICETCEHKKIIIGAKFCTSCGCAIWGKTLIRNGLKDKRIFSGSGGEYYFRK